MSDKLVLNHSGGMRADKAPLVLNDTECELAVNYELTRLGALRKRPGYTQMGSQTQSGKDVQNIAYANPQSRESNLIKVDNDVYRWDGAAWSSVESGISATYRYRIENFMDYTFRTTGEDDMKASINLTTWDFTNCPADATNFRPYYLKSFEKRLYGARGDGSGDGARLWWSDLWDGDSALTWEVDGSDDLVNYEDIGDGQSGRDPITGLEVNGSRLLIGKRNGLWRWQFGVENRQISNVGPLEQELMATNYELGITFFVSRLGIHSYAPLSEGRPRIISRPIQRWFNQIKERNWASDGLMTVDESNVYVFYPGDVTLDDVTVQNICFVYNIPLNAWTLWSFPQINIKSVGWDHDDSDNNLLLGDDDGNVYEFHTDYAVSDRLLDDNGSAIPTDFIGKEFLLSFPEQVHTTELHVFAETRGRTQTFFDVDRKNEFKPVGELDGRFTTMKVIGKPRHNTIRTRITSNFEGEQIIEGYNIRYASLNYNKHGKQL